MANTIDLDFDKKRILELEAKVIFLEATISKLFLVIDELNAKLAHKKNSRNSSLPPSKDENRPLKNQSLRPKSDKKKVVN